MQHREYLHIEYQPSGGWVLSIMSRLLNSRNEKLRDAFQKWSDTPLQELGFAITTRMHMLGLAVRRLNARASALRTEITADAHKLSACLSAPYAFAFKDKDFAYDVLLDFDSFIFETRSLYEIMGAFLRELFSALFDRKIDETELQAILSRNCIDTRWIGELRENRILFFHQTAPWLAVEVDRNGMRVDPVLMKKNTVSFDDPNDLISYTTLRDIYDGFVQSATALHQFVMQQIREFEESTM